MQNALISMYSLCGSVLTARRVFDELPLVASDAVTWNSMMSGYIENDLWIESLKLFKEFLRSAMPNEITLVSALTACGRLGYFGLGRVVHGLLVVCKGFDLDVFLGSSLIDMYGKCGHPEDARKVFDRIPERNVVCWTSMIGSYCRSDMFKEAIDLFREMQVNGVEADSLTVACIISACGHMGALDQGRWIHAFYQRSYIEMNLTVKNALIDMYAKCGDTEKGLEIFHSLNQKDVFSWTVMISGLAMNGKSQRALQLFSQMNDVKPNEVTFLGVLSACSHGGFVKKGFYYLSTMISTYGLIPHIEHYGCIVDLLGRANLLKEAEKFIHMMPIKPDVVIWRSLLFACRNHGNIELAEISANKIEEMEPRRCGARVLLSNVYASASRWSDVKRVRNHMAARGMQKQPGCSFIEINGSIHEFFAGYNFHAEMGIIYQTLLELVELSNPKCSTYIC